MSGPFSFIRSTVYPALGGQDEPPANPCVTRSSLESSRGRRGGPGRGEHHELPVQRPWGPTRLVGMWDGEDAGEWVEVIGRDPRFMLSEVGALGGL